MNLADIKAPPLAVWDAGEGPDGLFVRHRPRSSQWAATHFGQDVTNRTYRVEFFRLADAPGAPFAVLYCFAVDENGRVKWDPATESAALAEPLVAMLGELPPARLLGR